MQRHAARALAAAQLDRGIERHQHRRRIADRRAVGDIAAHRAGVAYRRRGEAQPGVGQRRRARRQRPPCRFQRRAGADPQLGALRAVALLDALQLGHVADIDDLAEIAELLRHPQPDIGRARQHGRLRLGQPQRGQRIKTLRRVQLRVAAAKLRGIAALQLLQRGHHRRRLQRRGRQVEHALAGIEDRPVAGAAAQVAGQLVGQLLARRHAAAGAVLLVAGEHRHREARRTEAALRAVAIDQRLLRRVQRAAADRLQVLDREQRLAVERGQQADAGVDGTECEPADRLRVAILGQLANDDGAGAAVALVAAFLGADAAGVLAQPVEHAAGGRGLADLDDLAAVEEADRLVVQVVAHWGVRCKRLRR